MTQTVHRWLALLVVVTVAGPQLRAQSADPKRVARQYTEAMRAGDWTRMAELIFVTDGACMASSGNQNPSITYMALTARACAYAVEQLNRREL